jgi:hypothetical protein
MENENDPFNSIILDESEGEEKSERKPRFINCSRCGKKIRNTPEKVNGHERYCKRKAAEKTSNKTEKPATIKPIIEKEEIAVKPADIKVREPPKKSNTLNDIKGFKFNAADAILLGGLVFTGLLFLSVIKPARPAENTTTATAIAPAQKAEPAQPAAPIAPPYPYYR